MSAWACSSVRASAASKRWKAKYVCWPTEDRFRVSPFLVPMMIPDMASGYVSIQTGTKAHHACTVTACPSGADSIGDAAALSAAGRGHMIAGGSEASVTRVALSGFCSARALSTRNDDPTRPRRGLSTRTGTDSFWAKGPVF